MLLLHSTDGAAHVDGAREHHCVHDVLAVRVRVRVRVRGQRSGVRVRVRVRVRIRVSE